MPVPATDDISTQGAIEGSAQYSPMTLLMRYFNSQGIAPSADNIRRAIEQNARQPGTIPGLRNAAPEDSSPAVPSTRVGSGGGQQLPVPPVPPTGGGGDGQPTTSAAPPGDPRTPQISVNGGPSAGEIATAIGLGGLLPAALFGMRGRGMPGASVPATPPITAPATTPGVVPTPGAGAPELLEPRMPGQGGIVDYTQLEPPRATPFESAMSKAVPSEPPLTGDMPPVSSDAVGNYRPGPSTKVENKPLEFNRGQRGQLTPPTAEQRAAMDAMRASRGGRVGRLRLRAP